MLILSPEDGAFEMDEPTFREAALEFWAPRVTLRSYPDRPVSLVADIARPDETGFRVSRHADGRALSTDGTREQTAEVAVWARDHASRLVGPLWLVDQGYTGHVEVTPDLRPEDVFGNWIEDSNAGNA